MTREEWQRVKAITGDALALPEAERAGFLAAHCADGVLRREVESLLAASVAATGLFEVPALATDAALAVLAASDGGVETFVGRRIGPYHVVRELGRGGMGTAYLAERVDRAYSKRVAIKLITRGMDTDAIVRRFLHERQILASLTHPNIAMLLDGGTTGDGRPYFIMEFVEGLPIDVFCSVGRLSIVDRLQLFRAICDAVDHAHENRVIHRDLKPSNILVTEAGVPKLLDFGIATLLDPETPEQAGDRTLVTRAMTLRYASPEQVRGGPVGAASDVYSLGVILYELLTGRPPYTFEGLSREACERLVAEESPPRPSTVVGPDAPGRVGEPAALWRLKLAGDLDTIVMTALRKEPARRYASARALADDIARHLVGEPIVARPDRLISRLISVARTRRVLRPAMAAALILTGAAIGWMRDVRRPEPPAITAVAVLPFVAEDGSDDLEYLADGLTESLINRLSRVSTIGVPARDSVYRYKGADTDSRRVARDLNVQAILTGRIRRAVPPAARGPGRGVASTEPGDDLMISVALIDARDDRQLWGEQYRRRSTEVTTLEGDIARTVAASLQLELSPRERSVFARAGTLDAEAYELYLRGRFFWNKRTTADFRRAIDYFRKAVDEDPNFALAYTGLADSYGLLTEYHGAPARETYPEARRAALRALDIDDELAEAHTSLAYVRQFYEWDWNGADAAFQRALELNPRYATARQWHAELLSAMGRHDEALAQIRQASALDPVSLIVNAVEAYLLYMARRYDEAIEQCRKVIEMDPNFPEVYEYLKRAYDQKGAYAEAIAARQTRRRLLGLDSGPTDALQKAAAASSKAVYWQKRLEQELVEGQREGLFPFEMAEILAQAGDTRKALGWLEQACATSEFITVHMRVAPNLDPLRAEPRFQRLLATGCRVRPS